MAEATAIMPAGVCADCGATVDQFPKYGRGISKYCHACLNTRIQGRAKRQPRMPRLLMTASAIARAEPEPVRETPRVIIATYPLPESVEHPPEPIIDAEIAALIRAKVREIAGDAAREMAAEVVRELAPEIARTAIRELLARVVTAAVK